jgi:hypothetical protein
MTQPIEYTFNASALGIGGTYVRFGREVVVPSVASVALAPTGGEGRSQVYGYNNDQGVEVASAFSFVKGSRSGSVFTTESEIDLVGLSLFGRVSIDHMYARVKSTRNNPEGDGADEATFEVTATYEGVTVDDCEVEPFVDSEACTATYASHHSAVTAARPMNTPVPSLERGDPLRRSVVADLALNGTAVTRSTGGPYILNVPGLGLMHFGELLVKRGRRRVNLIRFELGADTRLLMATPTSRDAFSADSGTLSIGSGDGNGEPVWPRQ